MALVAVKAKKNLPAVPELVDQAKEYARASKASETRRGYANDLKSFKGFCDAQGVESLPASPQTVALYLTYLAKTKAVATIGRHMVAIAQAHKQAGLVNPVADPHVRSIVQGIRRTKGTAQRRKTPITGELLRDVLLTLNASTLKDKRDRAIILLTFACAGRRSEIAALNVEDLRFEKAGLVVTIRRSKTDQTGAGREIGVPYVAHEGLCAVRALQAWLDASGISKGALFRTFGIAGRGLEQPLTEKRIAGIDIARLIQRVTGKAGLKGDFSGHSLRSGFITTASTTGVREVEIQRVSGHKSVTILRSYVRKANVLQDCPLSAMFGQGQA